VQARVRRAIAPRLAPAELSLRAPPSTPLAALITPTPDPHDHRARVLALAAAPLARSVCRAPPAVRAPRVRGDHPVRSREVRGGQGERIPEGQPLATDVVAPARAVRVRARPLRR